MAEKTPIKRAVSATPATTGGSGGPPAIPGFKWQNLAIIGGAVGVLWLTAFATGSRAFIAVVAVLTAIVVGLLGYVFFWARKQREMMELLQGANASPEARKEALAKLNAKASAGDKDVMNALARAQLEVQEDPEKALLTLEAIDMAKVPTQMADEVRAFRAQLYLINGRTSEARAMADEIKVSSASQPESRGMMAAVVAESWARTGKHKDALDLLQTIKPEDPDYGQAKVPLLFARIYAAFASGQRDVVKRDLSALIKQDVNLLGRFVMPKAKVHPELQKLAKDALQRDPEVRKMVQKQQSRGTRRQR